MDAVVQGLDRRSQALALGLRRGERGPGFAQFDRTRRDAGIERCIGALELGDSSGASKHAGNPCGKDIEVERLGDMVVGTGCESVDR
ncbi:hypothetical protein, partial [Sphingomonas sp.]|uniref:hypothetical protein n=1 Tax=Sphingomonas sp. TaxID=28214 RepID=UPI00258D01C7